MFHRVRTCMQSGSDSCVKLLTAPGALHAHHGESGQGDMSKDTPDTKARSALTIRRGSLVAS